MNRFPDAMCPTQPAANAPGGQEHIADVWLAPRARRSRAHTRTRRAVFGRWGQA